MELFAFWAFLALLVGALASSYGRSGFGWFLIALILSPLIGGIALLLAGRRDNSRRQSGATVKCPECREEIMQDARVCKHCGHRLLPPVSQEEVAAREAAEDSSLNKRRLFGLLIIAAIAYVVFSQN